MSWRRLFFLLLVALLAILLALCLPASFWPNPSDAPQASYQPYLVGGPHP